MSLKFIALFCAFVCCAAGAKYSIVFTYADEQCSVGQVIQAVATREDCGTIDYGTCTTSLTGVHTRTECRGVQPLIGFTGAVQQATFDQADCQGNPTRIEFYAGKKCINGATTSKKYDCDFFTNTLTVSTYAGTGCGGSASIASSPAACSTSGSSSTSNGCLAPCFHEETRVQVGDHKARSLEELRSDADCAIPHEYKAGVGGVRVTTTCKEAPPLRVTQDHLVYTQRGLVEAGKLVPNQDYLFRDAKETDQCMVVEVAADRGTYFGLNCAKSQVFADSYKTSTFGTYHTLPAAWMRWASPLLGVHRASAWGDAVVRFLRLCKAM